MRRERRPRERGAPTAAPETGDRSNVHELPVAPFRLSSQYGAAAVGGVAASRPSPLFERKNGAKEGSWFATGTGDGRGALASGEEQIQRSPNRGESGRRHILITVGRDESSPCSKDPPSAKTCFG